MKDLQKPWRTKVSTVNRNGKKFNMNRLAKGITFLKMQILGHHLKTNQIFEARFWESAF